MSQKQRFRRPTVYPVLTPSLNTFRPPSERLCCITPRHLHSISTILGEEIASPSRHDFPVYEHPLSAFAPQRMFGVLMEPSFELQPAESFIALPSGTRFRRASDFRCANKRVYTRSKANEVLDIDEHARERCLEMTSDGLCEATRIAPRNSGLSLRSSWWHRSISYKESFPSEHLSDTKASSNFVPCNNGPSPRCRGRNRREDTNPA
jgi:hypothetical protein